MKYSTHDLIEEVADRMLGAAKKFSAADLDELKEAVRDCADGFCEDNSVDMVDIHDHWTGQDVEGWRDAPDLYTAVRVAARKELRERIKPLEDKIAQAYLELVDE